MREGKVKRGLVWLGLAGKGKARRVDEKAKFYRRYVERAFA